MSAVTVDPRFRARRVAVKRAAGRRRLIRVAIALTVVGVVAGSWFVTRSPLLDVDHVRVDGAGRTTAADIAATGGVGPGTAMLDIRAASVERRLQELPWVDAVAVNLRWPGTVSVELTERTPVALALAAPDAWVQVDGAGRVLGPAPADSRLPRLSGIHAAGEPGTALDADARAALDVVALAEGHLDISGVYRQDEELWVRLASGLPVRFGADDQLDLKVLAAATVVDALAAAGTTSWAVDVSVPSAPVAKTTAALLEVRE
jgi:cell division protein FtsQ